MADTDVTLRLDGRGSLTFRDAPGSRWRRVRGGETFTAPRAVAVVLLADPNVSIVEDLATPAAGTVTLDASSPAPHAPTRADLVAQAEGLGLVVKARATIADLTGAIAAEEGRLAAAAEEAEHDEASDAPEGGETSAGAPEVDDEQDPTLGHRSDLTAPAAGTVTLDSLPPSARVQG
jgi:hypothetical protein